MRIRTPLAASSRALWCALCVQAMAVGVIALWAPGSRAQAVEPQLQGAELLAALRAGGLVILMRHMSTDDTVPADGTYVDRDCATQRNLDDEGRAQSEAVGRAIQALGIPIGRVRSSPYCRCVETGQLAFGEVEVEPKLAVYDSLSAAEKDERAKEIRAMVDTPPDGPSNTVLITHTGTLLYTFGLQTQPEGIAHVFRPAEFGQAIYVGRVAPAEWSQLAAGG